MLKIASAPIKGKSHKIQASSGLAFKSAVNRGDTITYFSLAIEEVRPYIQRRGWKTEMSECLNF